MSNKHLHSSLVHAIKQPIKIDKSRFTGYLQVHAEPHVHCGPTRLGTQSPTTPDPPTEDSWPMRTRWRPPGPKERKTLALRINRLYVSRSTIPRPPLCTAPFIAEQPPHNLITHLNSRKALGPHSISSRRRSRVALDRQAKDDF